MCECHAEGYVQRHIYITANSPPDAGMGNVVAAPKPTRIQRLKRLIRILDRHRSTLGRRVGRVSRELAVTENKLKACLSRKSAREAIVPNASLTQDSSVQVRGW